MEKGQGPTLVRTPISWVLLSNFHEVIVTPSYPRSVLTSKVQEEKSVVGKKNHLSFVTFSIKSSPSEPGLCYVEYKFVGSSTVVVLEANTFIIESCQN